MMRMRPSDLRRVGTTKPHVYSGPHGAGFVWSSIARDVTGTDGTDTFRYIGEADTAQQAKRVFCDWYNRRGRQ